MGGGTKRQCDRARAAPAAVEEELQLDVAGELDGARPAARVLRRVAMDSRLYVINLYNSHHI
jgi:hypothetical protein